MRKEGNLMSLTSELVSYIIGSRYEDLPKVAVENTKKYVLDTLGVIIAGSWPMV